MTCFNDMIFWVLYLVATSHVLKYTICRMNMAIQPLPRMSPGDYESCSDSTDGVTAAKRHSTPFPPPHPPQQVKTLGPAGLYAAPPLL